MTISATTQGLRMGVATSSSRPTVPFDGQVISETDTDSLQVYKGSAWAPVSGLTLIKAQTIGTAVSTVAVTSVFSATYDAYKIVVSGGVNSGANSFFNMVLGASSTGYYWMLNYNGYNASPAAAGGSNVSFWEYLGFSDTSTNSLNLEILNPFAAKYTTFFAPVTRTSLAGMTVGIHQVNTSFTDFTLSLNSGTITGGTVYVYGYAKA